MDLRTFLSNVPLETRESFATSCGTTFGHLRNVGYGLRECSPELAAALERESGGKVKRQDLRPQDWKLIWPELVKRKAVGV